MNKPKVTLVEMVPDPELKKKQKAATKAVERIFPNCGPVALYRTADGRIGFQMKVSVAAGDRKRLDEAYRAVMKVVGIKRGRPLGDKTVQAKLLLPQPVYSALKKEAKRSNVTMSHLVAETLKAHLPRHA
jgi:hypothetical protein